MPKLTGPLLSLGASGTFGPRMTFSMRKTGAQVRIQKAQKSKNTPSQLRQRGLYLDGSNAWNLLSSEDKEIYNDRAKVMNITGFNLYMKEYLFNPFYKIPITINKSQVSGLINDYTFYIDLATLGDDFWNHVKNGGGDIRIFASDKITQLCREIVFCDTATKKGEVYVKIPTISNVSDTLIYIYYGNTNLNDYSPTDTYGSNCVWFNNTTYPTLMLWRYGEGSGLSTADKSGNAKNGTIRSDALWRTGYKNYGYALSGNNSGDNALSYRNTFYSFKDNLQGSFTFNFKSQPEYATPTTAPRLFQISNRIDVSIEQNTGKMFLWFTDSANQGHLVWKAPTNNYLFDGNWHKITFSKSATRLSIFIDDLGEVGGYNTTLKTYNNVAEITIGNRQLYIGIDNINISSNSKDLAFHTTTYKNQETPATFYTIGQYSFAKY